MKTLAKILLFGFVIFMVSAVIQEWDFFSSAWFGDEEEGLTELLESDRQAVEQTVREVLALMRHLYLSGGDSRFAERMPASKGVLEEMLVDIDYLAKNQRLQDPRLQQLEIVGFSDLGENRVEVRTREFWQHRFLWLDGSGESDEEQWQILHARYLVVRGATSWQVQGWEIDDPQPTVETPEPETLEAPGA